MSNDFNARLFNTELTADERKELSNFWKGPTGSKVLRNALLNAPSVRTDVPAEQIHANAGTVKGWQSALQYLMRLAEHEENIKLLDTSPAYPSLDDEAAWGADHQPTRPA